ncbi:MAG: succinate dehydrogenase/fumarate reductase iron-sulfur subunit [Acidilobaceae archaeon]
MPVDLKAVTRRPPEVVKVRVKRFHPEKGESWWQTYEVKTYRGMTVLDALLKIKAEVDHTLVFRYSCRMGICGSCGVVVNGEPRLSCQTQISEKARPERPEVTVEPLYNFPVLRDLTTDFTEFFEKHRRVRPYLIRLDRWEREHPELEYEQRPEELEQYYEYTLCISCGLCDAACPVYASNPKFLGPQALAYAYRYIADSRDEGWRLRLEELERDGSAYRCHFAASCSHVCPKVVDPAGAIQRLRKALLKYNLRLFRKRTAKNVEPMKVSAERWPLPPEAKTIEGVDLGAVEKEPPVIPREKLLQD